MGKENQSLNKLEKLYKRNYFDTALFNWVESQRSLFGAVTVEQSIQLFCRFYELPNDLTDSLRVSYNRMKIEFYETMKK